MKYCPYCGMELGTDNDKFCRSCGKQIKKDKEKDKNSKKENIFLLVAIVLVILCVSPLIYVHFTNKKTVKASAGLSGVYSVVCPKCNAEYKYKESTGGEKITEHKCGNCDYTYYIKY